MSGPVSVSPLHRLPGERLGEGSLYRLAGKRSKKGLRVRGLWEKALQVKFTVILMSLAPLN